MSLLALAVCLPLYAGCAKSDPPSPAPSSSSSIVLSPVPVPVPVPEIHGDSSSLDGAGTGTEAGTGTGTGTGTGKTATPAASRLPMPKAAPTCGDKPLPACPLNAWMKANSAPALSAQDFGGLVVAFEKIAGLAPPGYTNWRSIAKDGADGARIEDADAAKAACRGCHNQYKERYKKEMRDRPVP
jgi:hypothetical protein